MIKYASVPAGDRLHQGEILAGLVRVRQSLDSIGTDKILTDEITCPYLVVLTQDCDLAQDADAREAIKIATNDPSQLNDADFQKRHTNAPKLKIDGILLCEAMTTTDLKTVVPPGKDIWKRLIQNKDERYHCIEAASAAQDTLGEGLPSLGCDFKRFFTVPADEVYKRIELNQITRRSRLVTPYAEHLLHRFCNFQARIPLPENHEIGI